MFSRIFSQRFSHVSFKTSLGRNFGFMDESKRFRMPVGKWLQPNFPTSHPDVWDLLPFLNMPHALFLHAFAYATPCARNTPFPPSVWKTPTHPSRPGSRSPSLERFHLLLPHTGPSPAFLSEMPALWDTSGCLSETSASPIMAHVVKLICPTRRAL